MRKLFIAFAAAALSALGAFADIKAVRAVPRDGGKPTKATMKRHAKKAEAAKNGGGAPQARRSRQGVRHGGEVVESPGQVERPGPLRDPRPRAARREGACGQDSRRTQEGL